MVNQHRKGIFFDDDNTEHIYFSAVGYSGKIGMTEVKICDQNDQKNVKFSAETGPNYDGFKSAMEKISQTGKR